MSPLAKRAFLVFTALGFLWATGTMWACLVDVRDFVPLCSDERFLEPGERLDLECCEEKRNQDFRGCVLTSGSNGYDDDFGLCNQPDNPPDAGSLDPLSLWDKVRLGLLHLFAGGARGAFLGCVVAMLVSLGDRRAKTEH